LKVKTFGYFAKEAITGLTRNSLMSLTALLTITLSLIIFGCFYIVLSNSSRVAEQAKGLLEIRVYLKDDADPVALYQKITKLPGVKEARYVSKIEGAKWLEKAFKMEGLYEVTENPLPNSIYIKLENNVKVRTLVKRLQKLPGVDEVFYSKTFVEFMLIVVQIVWVLGISLTVIMGIVVTYIIVNAIRITVFARRKEIEIMKLVGATDWFIRWPFLLEGMILGVVGSLLALIILTKGYHLLYNYVHAATPVIPLLREHTITSGLAMIIPATGVVFGAIGSMMSMKKFLRI
jgi:cell division transport system permease protein